MEVKIEDKQYQVHGSCPLGAPSKAILKRHLNQHGAESLVTSKKFGKYASCILEGILYPNRRPSSFANLSASLPRILAASALQGNAEDPGGLTESVRGRSGCWGKESHRGGYMWNRCPTLHSTWASGRSFFARTYADTCGKSRGGATD
jgi:hypothetical protein